MSDKKQTVLMQAIKSTNVKIDVLKAQAETYRLDRDYMMQNRLNSVISELELQVTMLKQLLPAEREDLIRAYIDGNDGVIPHPKCTNEWFTNTFGDGE